MRKMNILLTVAIVIVCGLVLWFGISAIIKIWKESVEIGEFVDDKDGSQGRRAQAIIDFVLREAPEIHRKADLSAISVGQRLEVPMVSRRDPGLEQIESLDIKVKDVHLNWVFGLVRALAKPSCEVSGRVMLGQTSTEVVVDLTDSSIRNTPIVVSVPRTADASNDTEQAATEAAYELLHAIYQHFAKDKSRVPGNWISLERFTEGLRELQEYRLAAHFGDAGDGSTAQDHLTKAINKLEQVRQLDPGYNDSLYYLGVAYFEQGDRKKEAREAFEELLKRGARAPQFFEARFYLGYAWFRTYDEPGLTNALTEYGKLKADLESRIKNQLPPDEKKRARGLLAETYSQIATTHAHLLFRLRSQECEPGENGSAARTSAQTHFKATSEYASKAEEYIHGDDISSDIRADVQWRRLNALGTAELSFACFASRNGTNDIDRKDYDEHCDKAIDYYEQALQSSPLNYNILQNMGEVYRDARYSKQDLETARELFLQSERLKPNDVYAPERLGMIYEALWRKSSGPDDEKKMIEYYKKAAQLGSEQAKTRLKEIYSPRKRKAR